MEKVHKSKRHRNIRCCSWNRFQCKYDGFYVLIIFQFVLRGCLYTTSYKVLPARMYEFLFEKNYFFFLSYQSYHFVFWQIGKWNILVLDFRWIFEIGIDQILDVTVVKSHLPRFRSWSSTPRRCRTLVGLEFDSAQMCFKNFAFPSRVCKFSWRFYRRNCTHHCMRAIFD
jgi:hypothetical protein